jgi:four helix bundle protein
MTHEELYERLCEFSDRVALFAAPLLEKRLMAHPADQLNRAASAAAANYRATTYARSHAEFCSKLSIALEEADEARHWLQRLVRRGAEPAAAARKLLTEGEELARILGASYRTATRNERDQAPQTRRQARATRGPGANRSPETGTPPAPEGAP